MMVVKEPQEASEIVKSYPEINWGIVGLPPLRIALYTCVAVTALGGILSNPLFKLANTAVSETPFLQDVIATANTKGQGSEDGKFIGTNVLNEAFLERFPVTFEQKYPSAAIEEKIVNKILEIAGKSDPDFTKKLITWAEVIRKTFFDGGIDEIVSTRRLVHIATAFTIFSSKMKAIEVCTNRFDDDTKSSFVDLYTKVDSGASAESILQEQQQSEVEGDSTSESDDSEEDSDATSAV